MAVASIAAQGSHFIEKPSMQHWQRSLSLFAFVIVNIIVLEIQTLPHPCLSSYFDHAYVLQMAVVALTNAPQPIMGHTALCCPDGMKISRNCVGKSYADMMSVKKTICAPSLQWYYRLICVQFGLSAYLSFGVQQL
jgi:hypothetical protein